MTRSRELVGRRADALRTLLLDMAAARAVSLLREAGVEAVLIKGTVTARWLYDDGTPRPYVDIDLVVAPDRAARAVDLLRGLGYEDRLASGLEREAIPHARTLRAPIGQATGFEEAAGADAIVDLHTGFHGVGASGESFFEALASGGEEIVLAGTSVPVPGEPARAMLVALHAGADGGSGRSSADLARAVERVDDPVWDAARALAVRLDAVVPFSGGLGSLPAGRELLARLGLEFDEARWRSGPDPAMVAGLRRLRRTPGPRAKARLLARELWPTPQFIRGWAPVARRGRLGLAAAYAWRPAWLLWRLPGALLDLNRLRGVRSTRHR